MLLLCNLAFVSIAFVQATFDTCAEIENAVAQTVRDLATLVVVRVATPEVFQQPLACVVQLRTVLLKQVRCRLLCL